MASGVLGLMGSATPTSPAERPVHGDEHDRLPAAPQLLGAIAKCPGVDRERLEVLRVANHHFMAFDGSAHPFSRDRGKVADLGERDLSLAGAADDRRSERMLADIFQARDKAQQRCLVEAPRRSDGHELRLALRQRPGLVDDNRRHLLEHLQRFGVPHQNAELRTPSRPHHNRHRRGEAERTGTGDDEHGDGIDQRMDEPRFRSVDRPHAEGDRGNSDHGGNKPPGHLVRETLNGRPRPLRFGDQPDDLGQKRVAADPLRLHHQYAGAIDGAARHFAPRRLLDRDRLTSDHRFIDRGLPFDHDAIHWNALSRTNAQAIAHLHVCERHVLFNAVRADTPRRLWRQTKQSSDGRAGSASGSQFQHLSEKHEHHDDRRRFEVHRDLAAHAERFGKKSRRQGGDHAERIRGADPQRDEREHVQVTAEHRCPSAHEERPAAPEDDRRGKRQ